MELINRTCTQTFKIEGSDFSGDGKIIDGKIDSLSAIFNIKGVQHTVDFGSESVIRDLHKELTKLFEYVDVNKNIGYDTNDK